MLRFSAITMILVILLALALGLGGVWPAVALVYITVFTYVMDKLATLAAPENPGTEFPAGTTLSISLGIAHFPLLFGGVAVLSLSESHGLLDKILIFIALSLFLGQVSNPNAHELIHRPQRGLRRLGTAVYASLLFGHHVSAHTKVHHVHAATDLDPNSARLGEGFYRYFARAWIGSLRAGWRAERDLQFRGTRRNRHPYRTYALGALAALVVAATIGGLIGVMVFLGLASYAQIQLFLSDYVQHYGLRRQKLESGKWEPVGPQHSWNAPNWFSSALMLNAPRHSDHHAHPSRDYPGLQLDRETMPILPYSLPVMAVIALAPPLWRRIMDPRAKRWQNRRNSAMSQA